MAELQNTLPSGWDCKYDKASGRHYYINHYTRTTTWDDPRTFHKQPPHRSTNVQVESIPMQHGSPEFRRNYVYPSQTTPIPAFQIPDHCSPKTVALQDLSNISKNSPRGARVQDSSLSLSSASNTEEAVTKISAMFPTVSDTHIRLHLKKYHNREALVISALQVEKHPITTPGPFATPPPTRNIHPVHAHLQMTPPLGIRFGSRGGSPILRPGSGNSYASEAYKNSPKPHSPKLKLRYMKSIFPQAEETMILDILSSNDNNIQKASDVLRDMGFEKRDSAKSLLQKVSKAQVEPPKEVKPQIAPVPKIKTVIEKQEVKYQLEQKYKDIAEQVIIIALESVDYDKERANQILQMMVDDNKQSEDDLQPSSSQDIETAEVVDNVGVPLSQSRQSLKSLLKTDKSEQSLKEMCTFSRVIEENGSGDDISYKSSNIKSTAGANRTLVKGANQDILLEDYVKWQGPQPCLKKGPQGIAQGPNRSLLGSRSYRACGSNSELRKGPMFGLAQGSIFSQMKGIVVGESRGK